MWRGVLRCRKARVLGWHLFLVGVEGLEYDRGGGYLYKFYNVNTVSLWNDFFGYLNLGQISPS